MAAEIVIFGASGHARVVKDVIECGGAHLIKAFAALEPKEARAWGYDVLDDALGLRLAQQLGRGIVAIGDNRLRWKVVQRLIAKVPNFQFITAIHPTAVVAKDSVVGPGSVVMPRAVINPGAFVGAHCVVNTSSSIEHDCTIGDYVTIAPGAVLGGGVAVQEGALIGLGAAVIQGKTIGKHAIVGAGACAVSDVPEFAVALGVPARVTRHRGIDEPMY